MSLREQIEDTWYDLKSFAEHLSDISLRQALGLAIGVIVFGFIIQKSRKPTLFQGKVTAIVDSRVQGSDSKEFPYEFDVRLQTGEVITVKASNIIGADIGYEVEINVFISDDDKGEKTYRYYPRSPNAMTA